MDLHPLVAEDDPGVAVFVHMQGAVETLPVERRGRTVGQRNIGAFRFIRDQDPQNFVVKADVQFVESEDGSTDDTKYNAGIGWIFN